MWKGSLLYLDLTFYVEINKATPANNYNHIDFVQIVYNAKWYSASLVCFPENYAGLMLV